MSEVNIPLLRKAVEWVEEQEQLPQIEYDNGNGRNTERSPREWAQELFYTSSAYNVCGTAYCLAGKVVIDEDGVPPYPALVDWVHRADQILGLVGVGHRLYRANNNAKIIRAEAERLAGERL